MPVYWMQVLRLLKCAPLPVYYLTHKYQDSLNGQSYVIVSYFIPSATDGWLRQFHRQSVNIILFEHKYNAPKIISVCSWSSSCSVQEYGFRTLIAWFNLFYHSYLWQKSLTEDCIFIAVVVVKRPGRYVRRPQSLLLSFYRTFSLLDSAAAAHVYRRFDLRVNSILSLRIFSHPSPIV